MACSDAILTRPLGLALLAALLLLLSAPAGSATAQGGAGSWSVPFDVSDDKFGWFPDLAIDQQGAVHVIWGAGAQVAVANRNSSDALLDLLRYRVLRNGEWSAMNDIALTCTGGFTVRNSIVANRDGQLDVLVRTCSDVSVFEAPVDSASSAKAWTPPQTLGTSYYNALASDSKGVLHAVYNENLFVGSGENGLLSEIFYRRSLDGGKTWSLRTNLANLPGGDERMQMKVDSRDRLHLAWDHGSDWFLGIDNPGYGVYRRSDDGGLTWREIALLGVAGEPTVQTTLALTRDDSPIVVFRSAKGDGIYYQTSSDGGDTWSSAAAIPGVRARDVAEHRFDSFSMATDSAGQVHLLMVGFPEGSAAAIPLLLHLIWDGQSWSAPEIVVASPTRPMWPRIIVAGGNHLHAVWFSYTDVNNWGERRVWYSGKTLDTPALPPVPAITFPTSAATTPQQNVPVDGPELAQPRAEPLPAATSGPAPVLSTTPPPTNIPGTQSYLIVALALLPVLGLIVTVCLIARWSRAGRR